MKTDYIINFKTGEKAKFVSADDEGLYGVVQIGPQSFESVYWYHSDVINHSKEDVELIIENTKNNLNKPNLTPDEIFALNYYLEIFENFLLSF